MDYLDRHRIGDCLACFCKHKRVESAGYVKSCFSYWLHSAFFAVGNEFATDLHFSFKFCDDKYVVAMA